MAKNGTYGNDGKYGSHGTGRSFPIVDVSDKSPDCFVGSLLAMTLRTCRHCEEASDEAIWTFIGCILFAG